MLIQIRTPAHGKTDPAIPVDLFEREILAAPRKLHALHFTFTNRCNLRCVYCPQGSHPEEFHAQMSDAYMSDLLRYVKQYQLREVGIGYYGELLLVEGWEVHANRILDLGVDVTAVSSFSRIIKPAEAATFARMKQIMFSIDTHDLPTLKAVRKAVDVRTITHNFHLVRAHCLANDVKFPELIWSGVLTDKVVEQLPDFVAFAASNGVSIINFNDPSYFKDAKNNSRNISDLDGPELVAAARAVVKAIRLAEKLKITFQVQSLDRLQRKLTRTAAGQPPEVEIPTERTGIQGKYLYVNDAPLPAGYTRHCTSPWSEAYLDPKGEVYSCCARGIVMGKLGAQADLAAVLESAPYRELRRSLFTGQGMDEECKFCPVRPGIPVEALQAIVREQIK